MHWFSDYGVERFVAGMADEFDIQRPGTAALEVSLASLPSRPTVVILRPDWLRDE